MNQNFPKHIAVVPDGNRRWARKRGLLPWEGHLAGVKSLEKILEAALEMEIQYFTFWVGSYDNFTKRSKIEVNFLLKLCEKYFLKLSKDKRVHQNQVKVNIFGRWQEIAPKKTQNAMKEAIEKTKNYNKYFLTALVAYNGTDEMVEAIKKISNLKLKNPSLKIDNNAIKENLWTKDLPPVDFLIRTGGEPHNSVGFMMWHTTDSQFYFTETLWPAFGENEFKKAIEEYSKRERRFGS